MRVLLLSIVLIGVSAFAQEFPTKGPATHDPTENSSRPRTYQGCLFRSNGGLTLKSVGNQEFRLAGSKSLDSYVGQEVRITGHDENLGDPSSDDRMGDPGSRHAAATLVVEDIQKVSDACATHK